MWHQGGQNFRDSCLFELHPGKHPAGAAKQIPRNTEACTTAKANRATHNPQICTSANDRAGWPWGRLAQVFKESLCTSGHASFLK